MMWVLLPTNTYKHKWLPKLKSRFSSNYFGKQGVMMLIFTFPPLLVAVLSCVYLHLAAKLKPTAKKSDDEEKETRVLATWRKPMLVKGPLGIVTGIELAFLVMFVVLLFWSLFTYFSSSFKSIDISLKNGIRWQLKLDLGGLWLGLVGNICLTLLFFPVARGSAVLQFFGLTSEGSIKYHIWLGHAVMTFFTAHGICYIVYWALMGQMSQTLKWSRSEISNVAGEISLLAGLGLWATTFPRIRRKMFELFFYTHYLYIVFVVFFVFHVGFTYACYMLPGFYLFLVDRYLRFLQSRRHVRLLSARILPAAGQTLELSFSKSPGLKYSPTSVLFLNVPGISKLQWHPFTVTSNSSLETDELSVVIKGEGKWTKKLYEMVSSSAAADHHFDVSVEGPYGPASTDFLRHETLVMISGGSGIAPFISIIRDLIFTSSHLQLKTPRLILISSFKTTADLAMLHLLLPITAASSAATANLRLTIEAYITREKQAAATSPFHNNNVRTKWFKPSPTHAPISPILGPTASWLWLAAVVSSSFLAFLVIIGILTGYYIYPEGKKHGEAGFPMALTAFLYMLVLCACVAAASSGAFLWNKRKSGRDQTIQIRNVEGATPTAGGSPAGGGAVYEMTEELESLPLRTIEEATNLHYGVRPNLRKLLVEYCTEGGSTGVMVSGPAGLRHEAAAICSSGLADDSLQFESISFSW
ncbi:unnamed protein product [Linum tenue]|uniref:FAD-binding FR-type domain-containing protein n=2 Tax=Linum tenue TaxID=586396 RepID=A0AAV0PNF2_9ROSI|nr:unnamed protein product [Linum tenue]